MLTLSCVIFIIPAIYIVLLPFSFYFIESFHKSIKMDYVWTNEFRTYEEANRSIKEAYKYYNEVRPHSTIGYLSSNEFINRWNEDRNFIERYLNNLDKERDRRKKKMEKRYNVTEVNNEVIIRV
jgi:putative transposase